MTIQNADHTYDRGIASANNVNSVGRNQQYLPEGELVGELVVPLSSILYSSAWWCWWPHVKHCWFKGVFNTNNSWIVEDRTSPNHLASSQSASSRLQLTTSKSPPTARFDRYSLLFSISPLDSLWDLDSQRGASLSVASLWRLPFAVLTVPFKWRAPVELPWRCQPTGICWTTVHDWRPHAKQMPSKTLNKHWANVHDNANVGHRGREKVSYWQTLILT